MAKRHVAVVVLAAMLGAVAIFGLSTIVATQEAKADLVTVKTCGGKTIKLKGAEKRILELQNKARARHSLKALCVNDALTKAAHAHSKEMIEKDYFSHNSFNSETVGERLKRFGYTYSGYSYYIIGENIGSRCGSGHTSRDMFKRWMSSSGHRASILNKNFREVGIGIYQGSFQSCSQAKMYTVDFGARRR